MIFVEHQRIVIREKFKQYFTQPCNVRSSTVIASAVHWHRAGAAKRFQKLLNFLQFFDNCDSGYAISLKKDGFMKTKMLIATAIFSMACALVYADMPVGADLTGHVTLPEGKSAAATVLITYAQLKTNFESSISTRHPILPKRAQAGSNGNFKIAPLTIKFAHFKKCIYGSRCLSQWLSNL